MQNFGQTNRKYGGIFESGLFKTDVLMHGYVFNNTVTFNPVITTCPHYKQILSLDKKKVRQEEMPLNGFQINCNLTFTDSLL